MLALVQQVERDLEMTLRGIQVTPAMVDGPDLVLDADQVVLVAQRRRGLVTRQGRRVVPGEDRHVRNGLVDPEGLRMIEAEGGAVVGQSLRMCQQGARLVPCDFVVVRGGGSVAGGLVVLRDRSRIGRRSSARTCYRLPDAPVQQSSTRRARVVEHDPADTLVTEVEGRRREPELGLPNP